jgi:hypothetical protein
MSIGLQRSGTAKIDEYPTEASRFACFANRTLETADFDHQRAIRRNHVIGSSFLRRNRNQNGIESTISDSRIESISLER